MEQPAWNAIAQTQRFVVQLYLYTYLYASWVCVQLWAWSVHFFLPGARASAHEQRTYKGGPPVGPVVPQAFRYGSGGATKAARGGVGAALSPHEGFRRAPVITFAGPAGDLIFSSRTRDRQRGETASDAQEL